MHECRNHRLQVQGSYGASVSCSSAASSRPERNDPRFRRRIWWLVFRSKRRRCIGDQGCANKTDSTRINLKLSNGSLRTVSLAPILNHQTSILNGPLHIPANTVKQFEEYYQLPNADITILSVAPHAHLIAHTWESYGVTLANDTIPLIKINNWNFFVVLSN